MKKILVIVSISLVLLHGCAEFPQPFKNLAKSDVDMITDIKIQKLNEYVKTLAIYLYEKNPQELAKTPQLTMEHRLAQILEFPNSIGYEEIDYLQSTKAVELSFSKEYQNDRVFALMLGINSMLKSSYNNNTEMFVYHKLNPQALYNTARNLERINHRLRIEGQSADPLLNLDYTDEKRSAEDIISRMIAIQDIMATVVAEKNNRVINRVVYGTATALVPIGI